MKTIRGSESERLWISAIGWCIIWGFAASGFGVEGSKKIDTAFKSDINAGNVCMVIDTFSSCIDSKTQLPCGWHVDRRDATVFSLERENGNYFVKIKTKGGTAAIAKSFPIDCNATPYLHWRWRAHVLPEEGNENIKKKDDSGASVYVFFPGPLMLKKIVKYVWSTTLAPGTRTVSPFYFNLKVVVLRSGNDSLGKWIHETVNVLDDYTKFFGSPPDKAMGIALLSDGDNTNSSAEADYDDFYLSAKP